ncbi:MAG TPA: hypothetical protein VE991_01560, partial [Acidimicrobiales bacterium]|nr:hypothetical protein [Acidimicrobiales bacterium]
MTGTAHEQARAERSVFSRGASGLMARVAAALGSGLLASTVVVLSGTSPAGAADSGTQGSAYSQLFQVTPYEGSLAAGAVFGEALAGHTNGFARAQSQGMDLGAVGDSIKSYNCGSAQNQQISDAVPDPLETETGAQGASTGQTQQPSASDYGATEYVQATDAPYGEADTTYVGPVADPTGAIMVSGMHARSWSGVVNGATVAAATSDIGQLILGNGAVALDALHWATTYPLGGGQPTSSFSIGSVTISGNTLPPTPDLSALTTAINTALATVGLKVSLPVSFLSQGVQFVSPLEVDVVPNDTRDQVLDPVFVSFQKQAYGPLADALENGFATAQPPYNSLAQLEAGSNGQQLAQNLCKTDSLFTVADIAMASVDGGGHFTLSFGGAQASASPVTINPYSLVSAGFGTLSLAGSSTFIPGTAGGSGILTANPTPLATAPAPADQPSTQPLAVRTRGLSPAEKAGSL